MDEIIKLYEAMQRAKADGYSDAEINAELQRRGFPGDFGTLAQQAGQHAEDLARGSRGSPTELASTAANGLTFGLGPKIAARAVSLIPGQGGYGEVLQRINEPIESLRARRPGVAAATEIGAGLATTPFLPGGGTSKTFLGALGRGAGTGALYGALSGAGHADPGEEMAGLAKGGLFGAAVGLPFGVLSGLGRLAGPGRRLASAVEAEGEDHIRQSAADAIATGRGKVVPVGALGPYLQSESEYAATRSPGVYGKYRGAMLRRQAGEADRLTRDVSRAFGKSEVGSEALAGARSEEFDPLYAALDKSAGRIEDPRLANILSRPTVAPVMDEAIKTGMLSDVVESLPSFRQLNELRQVLLAKANSLMSTPGGDKSRMAALFQTAHDLESVIEDNVPEFRALQSAYREASRPINIIELARLEAASQGRASPALDRASKEARTSLLRAFGSSRKYRDFMLAVDQERKLAGFTNQVFGGSPTARRMLGEGPAIAPEDVASTAARGTAVSAPWALSRLASAAIPKVMRERTARAMAPLLFAPSSDIERVLAEIARRNAPGKLQFLGQTFAPAAAGLGLSRY
jgi:hypothetical protein